MSASGFNTAGASFNQNAPVPAVGAGGSLTWNPFGPLDLRVLVEGTASLSRPSFVVLDAAGAPSSQVYQPSATVGRALFGAAVHFP